MQSNGIYASENGQYKNTKSKIALLCLLDASKRILERALYEMAYVSFTVDRSFDQMMKLILHKYVYIYFLSRTHWTFFFVFLSLQCNVITQCQSFSTAVLRPTSVTL